MSPILDAVAIFFDGIDAMLVHRFGDDVQAISFANLDKQFQPIFAEALKSIRGCSRLKGSAAKEFYTALGNRRRRFDFP